MRINFFDLGSFDGMESKIILDVFEELNIDDFRVYAFEPCLDSFNKIKNLIGENNNVVLVNAGISDKNDKSKLYHSFSGNEVGHSIFSTKNNVFENDYEEIDVVKFSDWCNKENVLVSECLNIIKFNIEGAEWHLINDLIDSNLIQHIHIFCGDGIDIYKIAELNKFVDDYELKLKKFNINIIPFSAQGYENEISRVSDEKNILKNKIKFEYEKFQNNKSILNNQSN